MGEADGSGAAARPRQVFLGDLSASLTDVQVVGDANTIVSGVVYDSREVRSGDLFAALPGADADGHEYAERAVEHGASALLVERRLPLAVAQLVVTRTRAALAPVAARFYGEPSRDLGVIGITGTDGKTTTSYLVDGLLRAAGLVTGMVGTVAVRIGDEVVDHDTRQTTPESADVQRYLRAMVDAGVSWAVLEATSHGLDLHRLDNVRFAVAAVTNITHEHLEHHGTIAAYRRAKGILFERVGRAGGAAVVNVDDPGAAEMIPHARGAAQLIRYSATGQPSELWAEGVAVGRGGSTFVLRGEAGWRFPVSLPLVGAFNVANALCAAGVGLAAGLAPDAIAGALSRAPAVPGRMVRIDEGQPFEVVVDYAHTPESLANVLGILRALNPSGRLIAVFGSAGERDIAKRALQGAVAARLADYSVFTTEDPRNEDPGAIIEQIAAGAAEAGARRNADFVCITDREEAIGHAISRAEPGDTVLLAGKGHEGSIIWGREKRAWDEEAIARRWLAAHSHRRRSDIPHETN